MIIGKNKKLAYISLHEGGGSAGSGTKFSSSEISTKLAALESQYEELTAAIAACKAAGEEAVAAGGAGVGGAIDETIVTITQSELATIKAQIVKMQGQLGKVKTEYAKKNQELIDSIKAIKKADGQSAPGAGHQGLNTSFIAKE